MCSYYSGGNRGTERLCKLLEVSQPARARQDSLWAVPQQILGSQAPGGEAFQYGQGCEFGVLSVLPSPDVSSAGGTLSRAVAYNEHCVMNLRTERTAHRGARAPPGGRRQRRRKTGLLTIMHSRKSFHINTVAQKTTLYYVVRFFPTLFLFLNAGQLSLN